MLGEGLRAYELGRQRIRRSGEYAVPLLLQTLSDPKTPQILQERIVTMLEDLGRSAVRPYSVALQSKDLKLVGFLANALGRIEYPSALPRLREALLRPELQDPNNTTRKRIVAAMISCAGGDTSVVEKSPAELFYQLAKKYYQRADSILPESVEGGKAFVWFWKEGTGLIPRPVPKEILCDIYAMRFSRLALKYDPAYSPAVPLWLSACIRREIDLPAGQTDPLWGKDQPKAEFYALASSPQYLQSVLATALQDGNVDIATRAITTMGRNTGASSLVTPLADGAMPLVSALGYPDKNVRFLAAETLMLAAPTKEFYGYEVVTSLMSDALREEGKKYALVVATNSEVRNDAVDAVRGAGFEVIEESNLGQLLAAAQKEVGLDAVFIGPDTPAGAVVTTFRKQAMYNYLPIVVNQSSPSLRELAGKDGKIVLIDSTKIDAPKITEALKQAVALAAGKPLSKEQAAAWSIRAAKAIQAVGRRDNVIYDIRRATEALCEALNRDNAELQVAVADALAVINTPDAQQAVVGLALGDGDEKVRIAAFQAASRSVRRFGNRCDDAQAKALVDLVTAGGSQPLLEAAAQLLGTMNLPSEKTPALIESTDKID
jgi:HEAT repeat protein